MKKNGRQSNLQRYLCQDCKHSFQTTNRTKRNLREGKKLWKEYTFAKKTLSEIANEKDCSSKRIQRLLTDVVDQGLVVTKQKEEDIQLPVTLVLDTTYFDTFGVMVFRCSRRKKNLLWYFVESETNPLYCQGIEELEEKGYIIAAVVCDGKRWLPERLGKKYPVQLCQFHMMKTVTKYITKYPKSDAGKELRMITLTLPYTTRKIFRQELLNWYCKWQDFLNEKTLDEQTQREYFTHQRLRQAYASLLAGLKYLFTNQDYPEFQIPNTTNTLDGTFSHLKQKVNIHRGIDTTKKKRMIETILLGKNSN